jgi:glycosyltransferase involved in cell wall biosynthesis
MAGAAAATIGGSGMSVRRRLSVCYAVPGHCLIPSAGPTRNVLNLARALNQWADVTVAFQRVAEVQFLNDLRIDEIEPNARHLSTMADDSAVRGVRYGEFLCYLRQLRRFAAKRLLSYDVVLEKSWLLSGYLSAYCRRHGVLGVPVENVVPNASHVARGNLSKFARLQVGRWLAGRYLRKAPLIIAETEFLKADIAANWRVAPERIAVVDLGVDGTLFRPLDQAAARRSLGIALHKTVLLYVGVLDDTHDLGPPLEAVAGRQDLMLELHVVGDGHKSGLYREQTKGAANVVWHGRVAHDRVPEFIAAADLCVAPYDPQVFAAGKLGYSSMKIPEYLACGRAVASVPSGRIPQLVQDSSSGFLFPNDLPNWRRFLAELPSRERLRGMGEAAAQVRLTSWEDTARSYLSLCERQLASMATPRA